MAGRGADTKPSVATVAPPMASPAGQARGVDLSVVVVTHDSAAYVGECLRAIAAAAAECSHETIVVDNASSDGTPAFVRRAHPEIRVVEAGRNAGFAAACNIGIAAAAGRHVVLLNPDAQPRPGSLAAMAALLDRDVTIGVAGPRLCNPDLTDQRTARMFPTPAVALFGRRSPLARLWPSNRWTRRYLAVRVVVSDRPFDIDWMSGACLMVRRGAIEQVGALDERYFLYWEDADWCRRMNDAGFRVVCEPRAVVVHDEGAQRGRGPRQTIWFHQSAYRYYVAHHLGPRDRAPRVAAAALLACRALVVIVAGALSGRRPA